MADFIEQANDPKPADPAGLLEHAINNLSLGLIIFDSKREVVFCNQRYAEIYRLSSEQIKPGTPISELIRHRLNLGLKVLSKPDEYIRDRFANAVVAGTTSSEFTDGRIISYTVYPMPDGGGMATHEDITEREELSARLKRQVELGQEHEENLRLANLQFDQRDQQHVAGPVFLRRRPSPDRVQRSLPRHVRSSTRSRPPRHAADRNRRHAFRSGKLSRDVEG